MDSHNVERIKELGLKRFLTSKGRIIDYKFESNKSYYFLQWGGNKGSLQTFPDTLFYSDPPVRNPYFKEESKNYIVMKYGCGSDCWAGIFLPLYKGGKPKTIYYYCAYDLDHDLVVSIDLIEKSKYPQIIIHNLRTGKVQMKAIKEGCLSASPSYCLDSISIKNKVLYYKWAPNLTDNPKGKGVYKRQIKVNI